MFFGSGADAKVIRLIPVLDYGNEAVFCEKPHDLRQPPFVISCNRCRVGTYCSISGHLRISAAPGSAMRYIRFVAAWHALQCRMNQNNDLPVFSVSRDKLSLTGEQKIIS
jgi:hypothetical protein